ncbi:glycosyltransferase family 4 protein [Segnochrobactrum spirostomi]|uniref:Glycosyltransferase family 4 protein n=1 Tax=Segnochrobactrum spirostomi TaxID=2608987 RepID=A0A6A7Y9Y1_9HYPH|nr:glycosyltransferase family 1 protein [Segnochrobactrum spirostomi]MQT15177.1 glycosyltransferase family 4 protein [Segnochrobactrum spirostomi]
MKSTKSPEAIAHFHLDRRRRTEPGTTLMHRPIAFSLIRALLGSLSPTPRGIERIDFGYISHLLDHWPADCFGVLPTPWGMRYFPRERILKGRDRLAAYWNETASIGEDGVYSTVVDWLDGCERAREPRDGEASRGARSPLYNRLASLILEGGVSLGRAMSRLPNRTIYLDIGHTGVSHGALLGWLRRRPDVDAVLMLHDAIPLERPDLVHPSTVAQHRRVMANTAAYARAVITPTQAAADAIQTQLASIGGGHIPLFPLGLPIDDAFSPAEAACGTATTPYFVVCGAIEPRKNQSMLLSVWRELLAAHGAAAPRLVLAGRPGHGSDYAVQEIRQSNLLSGHVLVASGLSSPALARLIAGARALLMPSFAEGFGLPPVEALSVGTPAVLSDIPAHREASGAFGIYLDPHDPTAWHRAISDLTADTESYRALKKRIAEFRPLRWDAYMARVGGVLDGL